MATILAPAELAAITTIAEARTWAGLPEDAWNAFSAVLGTVPTLQVLAYVPAFAIKDAVQDARVPIPAQGEPGTDGHVPASDRNLTIVEGTQAGMIWQLARQNMVGKFTTLWLCRPLSRHCWVQGHQLHRGRHRNRPH